MKRWGIRLLFCFQFLTRIPVPIALPIDEEDMARCMGLFPIVGLVGGVLCAALATLASFFWPMPWVLAALCVVLEVIYTGGLHLDGLSDTCDGIFSGRERIRTLEIMRDSHLGTFGALSLMVDLFLKFIFMWAAFDRGANPVTILVASQVLGRLGLTTAAASARYAREGQGLGKHFIDRVRVGDLILGSVLAIIFVFVCSGLKAVIVVLPVMMLGFLLAKALEKKLGGITGDCLGFVQEICQIATLMALSARWMF